MLKCRKALRRLACDSRLPPSFPRKATIEDVARKAQVSNSTASRVINRPQLVNETTRSRVENVIKPLAFRPNAYAQGLMRSRSNLRGLGSRRRVNK
jgi:LacI family transcriptional regulator